MPKSDLGFFVSYFLFLEECVCGYVCVCACAILNSVDLNIFDVVQSISVIFIDAQIIPSLVSGNLFKLTPEPFSQAL